MAQPTFVAVGTEYSASATGPSHPLVPPSASSGQMLIAVLGYNNLTTVITPPAGEGWTPMPGGHATDAGHFDVTVGGGTTAARMAVFYKQADGTEPANYTFTSNTNIIGQGRIFCYDDIDWAAPFGGLTPVWQSDTSPTGSIVFAALSGMDTSFRIIRISGGHFGTATPTFTPPGDHSLRGQAGSSGGVANRSVVLIDKGAAGATDGTASLGVTGTFNAYFSVSIPLNGTGTGGGGGGGATADNQQSGGVTPSSFKASAKFSGTTSVKLAAYSDSGRTTKVAESAAGTPNATNGYLIREVTGLSANTQYYYGWLDAAASDALIATGQGLCKTFPDNDAAASFRFAAGSCSRTGDTNAVFTRIKNDNPLMFIHMGDRHYEDTSLDDGYAQSVIEDEAIYITHWEQAFDSSTQQDMMANVPISYVWSDHDGGGGGWSRDWVKGPGTTANLGRPFFQSAYRKIFPEYTLPSTVGAIWKTWQIGRVHFFHMDLRSDRDHHSHKANDDVTKKHLGTEQLNALLAWASDPSRVNMPKVLISEVPPHEKDNDTGDGWGRYIAEREAIRAEFAADGVTNYMFISGDQHAASFYDGSGNDTLSTEFGDHWNHAKVAQCGGLIQSQSVKGGNYTQGPLPASGDANLFGRFDVTDTGTSTVTVEFTPVNGADGTSLFSTQTITFTDVGGGGGGPTEENISPTAIVGTPTGFSGTPVIGNLQEDPAVDTTDTDGAVPATPASPQTGLTNGPEYPDSRAAFTGSTTIPFATTPANAIDTSDTTSAATASATGTTADWFQFLAADWSDIPLNAIITGISFDVRHQMGTNNRGYVTLQMGTANGAGNLLGSNFVNVGNNTLGSTSNQNATLSTHTVNAFGVLPTRAQLVSGTFGVQMRLVRGSATVYTFYSMKATVTYSLPGDTTNTSITVSFPTPSNSLEPGALLQGFEARVAKIGAGNNPSARIELLENGTLKNAASNATVTGSQIITHDWAAADVTDQTGAGVEARVIGVGAEGGAVAVYSVIWRATVQEAVSAQNIVKTITDSLGITDSNALARAKVRTVSDTMAITDSSGKVIGKVRVITDTVAINDSATRSKGLVKSVTDTLGLNDAATRSRTLLRSATDNLGITDAASRASTKVRTVTDSLGVLDSVQAGRLLSKAVTDTLSIVDAVTPNKGKAFTITDALGINDAVTRSRTLARSVTDGLAVTDSQSKGLGKNITDALGITDAATRTRTLARTTTDNLGISDTANKSIGKFRTVTDNIGITDNATRTLIQVIVKTITDTLGITDAATKTQGRVRTITDTIGITDTATRGGTLVKSITDTLGITDTANRSRQLARGVTDTMGLTDAANRSKGLARTVSDTLGITDTASRLLIQVIVKTITDSLGMSDTITRTRGLSRTQTDNLGMTDSTTRVRALGRTVTDNLGLADNVTRTMSLSRAINDALGITDSATPLKLAFIQKTITDSLGISDSAQRQVFRLISKSVTDTMGISDSVTRNRGIVRVNNDTLGITDATVRNMAKVRSITDQLGLQDTQVYSRAYNRIITDSISITDQANRVVAKYVDLTDTLGISDEAQTRIIGFTVAPEVTVELVAIPSATVELVGIPAAIVQLVGIPDAQVTLEP